MLGDLRENVQYYRRVLSQYGYDRKTGRWDTKLFPVTQTDRQMQGFKLDIDKYRKAVKEYNEYVKHLAKKYNIDINNECRFVSNIR